MASGGLWKTTEGTLLYCTSVSLYDVLVLHWSCSLFRGITTVVLKKREGSADRFSEVEFRLGDTDESDKGSVHLSANALIGFFNQSTIDVDVIIRVPHGTMGRFLTVQRIPVGRLQVDEVSIYF